MIRSGFAMAIGAVLAAMALESVSARAEFGEEGLADDVRSDDYAGLAAALETGNHFQRKKAADQLLRVNPADVSDANVREQIARGFKDLAFDERSMRDEGIRGMVLWGGQHSLPLLIDLLERQRLRTPDSLFDALAQYRDPKAAEAVTRQLGNFFNHDAAVHSLRKMGPVAEPALIDVAPSNNSKISVAAVELLGEVGTSKSMRLLERAAKSRNAVVKTAARTSLRKIASREKHGDPIADATADTGADSDSPPPFAKSMGDDEDAIADVSNGAVVGTGDWSQVDKLLPSQPAGNALPLDPARETQAGWRPRPVRLTSGESVHERPVALAVGGGEKPIGVVIYYDPFHKSYCKLESVDLRRRNTISTVEVEGQVEHCFLSPSGSRLLVVGRDGTSDRKARLAVWDLSARKPKQVVAWMPYLSGDVWDNMLSWADWLDQDQLLTFNGQGQLVLWRVNGTSDPLAVYQLDIGSHGEPALSPGRAYVAAVSSSGVDVFRAVDGELLARLPGASGGGWRLAFSPSSRRLAALAGTRVCVWDASTGRLERDFDCLNLSNPTSLCWLDEALLLAGDRDVVDVDRRLIVWRYEGSQSLASRFANRQWTVFDQKKVRGLVPFELPHAAAREAAEGIDADSILALKPGTKVSLDNQVGAPYSADVAQALTAAIEASDLELSPNQPIRFMARVEIGDSSQTEYRRIGGERAFDIEQANVTARIFSVELQIDGQTAWLYRSGQSTQFNPMHIQMNEGESVQQAVDRQMENDFKSRFRGLRIPSHVVHPDKAGPLGTSQLTISGIQ